MQPVNTQVVRLALDALNKRKPVVVTPQGKPMPGIFGTCYRVSVPTTMAGRVTCKLDKFVGGALVGTVVMHEKNGSFFVGAAH
ncbi:hypothetical protein F6X40_35270 [Paraburkholderia sp. UCT31]|uniref:hypothetical protein n=1 Tax=Paraburkholderia sp. UCT31 TaxID=2615209 RepID=UPI0016552AA2|nr:hypothetical protein [Paraburkholderia sp. UCT31]MBC8741811.1 hypothetical protein [Paraburkholderia sp. UCT31]